jgi:hypothetical protein
MSASSRRAARHELKIARALGTERTRYRGRYERKPDMLALRLPDGQLLSPEAKYRDVLPKWITDALAQARGYGGKNCIALAAFRERRGMAIVVLSLEDFLRLSAIKPYGTPLQQELLTRAL